MPIMDIDRPHLKPITNTNTPTSSSTTITSDLFICFTSLLTTHSHHSTSLTTSLSRRLRRNGSITKRVQAQSPAMFQTNHHEPSSPKVTCIGQVRGKSRKHGEKMKMLACRSHPPRNQKWVHLPLTICDTLKEFSCLIPCKSSCFSSSNSGEISDNKGGSSSCGGVFRWMVSLHDGEGGGRRDVELVVNGDEDELMERSCSRRRSIFDDMEFDDLFNNVGIRGNHNDNDNDNGNDGGNRVSICVPPKNALLLMRCRSDPMRMASLSQKLWDPPLVQQHQHDDEEVIQDVVVIKEEDNHVEFERVEEMVEVTENSVKLEDVGEKIGESIEPIVEDLLVCSEKSEEKLEDEDDENSEKTEENREELEGKQEIIEEEEGNLLIVDETQLVEGLNLVDVCIIETITVEDKVEECGNDQQDLVNKAEDEEEIEMQEKSEKEESCVLSTDSSTFTSSLQDATAESTELESKEQEKVIVQGEARKSIDKENNKPMLPDCLLLMMCEPKLSMEVSKETWVCGTDFIRWLPERHQGSSKKGNKVEGGDDQSSNNSNKKTKASAVAALPPLPPSAQGGRSGIQPGRSSISFPASGGSVANLIEQKLAKAGVGFEPFVLTRCKSAPMRSTAKFEPHRPATCGVGAAGVGF